MLPCCRLRGSLARPRISPLLAACAGTDNLVSRVQMAIPLAASRANVITRMLLGRGANPFPARLISAACGGTSTSGNHAARSCCYRQQQRNISHVGCFAAVYSRRSSSISSNSSSSSSRRRFSGVVSNDTERERERFLVTGSLLDARRAGSDSPLPGQFLSVSHAFGPEAMAAFAAHAGDDNPIHVDEEYARNVGARTYDGCIVHGLMVAGLFSTAFGRAIPGALYVSQTLRFERPVRVGERVDVRVEVERARVTSSGREVLVRCSTLARLPDGSVAVSGQAKVLLPRTCEVRSW